MENTLRKETVVKFPIRPNDALSRNRTIMTFGKCTCTLQGEQVVPTYHASGGRPTKQAGDRTEGRKESVVEPGYGSANLFVGS